MRGQFGIYKFTLNSLVPDLIAGVEFSSAHAAIQNTVEEKSNRQKRMVVFQDYEESTAKLSTIQFKES